MSFRWIGLRQGSGGRFAPGGLACGQARPDRPAVEDDTPMTRGTIRLERIADPAPRPQNLLRLSRRDPDPRLLTLRIDPGGMVVLIQRSGAADNLVMLDLPACPAGSRMTIQYGWDLEGRLGYLWAEIPSIGAQCIRPVPKSLGLSMADMHRITTDGTACQLSPEVTYAATAIGLAPAGPLPGLDGAGLVQRSDGRRSPLETLRPGDEVIAADEKPAQVRWAGAVDVPAAGRLSPFRVNTPYHGARAPLVLSGTTRLRLGGIAVEYLFGESEVAVQVRHLKDNVAIVPARPDVDGADSPLIRYHQLILDRPVPIRLSGVMVETLDCSQLIGNPSLLIRSVLADTPPEILSPEIAAPCKVLREYEAQSLRQMQSA